MAAAGAVLFHSALIIGPAWAQLATQVIAVYGDPAPDGIGTFRNFHLPALNDAGQAAFFADTGSKSIFRGAGEALTQIARSGQLAPDGNGRFIDAFGEPALNEAGQAAFNAQLINTAGGSSDDRGIFRGDGGALTQIVREGQLAPDANGSFSLVGSTLFNEAGQAAFHASLTGTSSGIFRGDGVRSLKLPAVDSWPQAVAAWEISTSSPP
jgi:hypothetical protein